MPKLAILHSTPKGLYCPLGDFYIDPWRPVPKALITHAHGDHLRSGHGHYWCSAESVPLVHCRVGPGIALTPVVEGEVLDIGKAQVSFHPAGHILGSSQIRVEAAGQVWIVSGDYKRAPDPTCRPFEVVPCDTFISEATFALPIYQWPPMSQIVSEILTWWERNIERQRPGVLFCYSLGKAQRVLAELAVHTQRPVYIHGAMEHLTQAYRHSGIAMLPTLKVSEADKKHNFAGDLILAPPSAYGSPWMRRFKQASTAFASGWMQIRGNRRRKAYDRGFVLSDHADWPALLQTIRDSQATQVIATHGNSEVLARYLREAMGLDAKTWKTAFDPALEDDAS